MVYIFIIYFWNLSFNGSNDNQYNSRNTWEIWLRLGFICIRIFLPVNFTVIAMSAQMFYESMVKNINDFEKYLLFMHISTFTVFRGYMFTIW